MIQRSIRAWKMLILALPKGIMAFVIAIAGISISMPLVIIWVGLPLLSITFAACRTLMSSEQQVVEAWSEGRHTEQQHIANKPAAFRWEGLRALGTQLRSSQSYRGILYCIVQLPVGILAFTLSLVLPSVAISGLLAPAVQKISSGVFSYDPNMLDPDVFFFLSNMTSYERSWIVCGMGFVLLLFLPVLLQGLGRMYAAWISGIAGEHQQYTRESIEIPA